MASMFNLVELPAYFLVSIAAAPRQQPRFTQGQARIGKRQSINGLTSIFSQGVFAVEQYDRNADFAQHFQIPIEAADAQTKPPGQRLATLGSAAQECQQAKQPSGAFRSDANVSRGGPLFGHGSLTSSLEGTYNIV